MKKKEKLAPFSLLKKDIITLLMICLSTTSMLIYTEPVLNEMYTGQ